MTGVSLPGKNVAGKVVRHSAYNDAYPYYSLLKKVKEPSERQTSKLEMQESRIKMQGA